MAASAALTLAFARGKGNLASDFASYRENILIQARESSEVKGRKSEHLELPVASQAAKSETRDCGVEEQLGHTLVPVPPEQGRCGTHGLLHCPCSERGCSISCGRTLSPLGRC